VHNAAAQTVAGIRADGRPRFLELVTYRLRGHFEPDDQSYVDAAELDHWRRRDPLRLWADHLLAEGRLDAEALAVMARRAQTRVEAAVAFAQASAWPDADTLQDHVYA